jgi:hypothetical protein
MTTGVFKHIICAIALDRSILANSLSYAGGFPELKTSRSLG